MCTPRHATRDEKSLILEKLDSMVQQYFLNTPVKLHTNSGEETIEVTGTGLEKVCYWKFCASLFLTFLQSNSDTNDSNNEQKATEKLPMIQSLLL